MTSAAGVDREPAPLGGLAAFEEGDFHALSERLSKDPQFNDRRLVARRKLGAIAKEALARVDAELDLVQRTSLHQPNVFNHMRVRRLWAYVCRGKKAKAKLKRVIGAELAKDLDAAYRNAYLCVALESEAIEVSLRIHPEAWYDGQNLRNRIEREGPAGWLTLLNALPGYHLRLDDWKGEWPCGKLGRDRLEEYLRYWKPGEKGLAVECRWPAPPAARGPALGADVPRLLVDELVRLLPLYRYAAWSDESDHLFSR